MIYRNQILILVVLIFFTSCNLDFPYHQMTPEFSHNSGFYTESFELSLFVDSAGFENRKILYTLDGSVPVKDGKSTRIYKSPVPVYDRTPEENFFSKIPTNKDNWKGPTNAITKATVVRARVTDEHGNYGATITKTYWVGEELSSRYNIPVISLATDYNNLFDDKRGIYVPGSGERNNYAYRGRAWERPAHIKFFENDGSLAFAQDIGIRIHGGWSRNLPQKSLRLYARRDYDMKDWFNHEIFPGLNYKGTGQPANRFKRLVLRNSGNDWNLSFIRDGMMQELVSHLSINTQSHRPVIIFINGEFWGFQNIRQRYDDRYLETHYGIAPDDIAVLENSGAVSYGSPGAKYHYLRMVSYAVTEDLSISARFNEITKLMDMKSYIDLYSSQIYFGNHDWPQNNILYWRYLGKTNSSPGQDGRWRWMLIDTDFGFRNVERNMIDWVTREKDGWHGYEWSNKLFRALTNNHDFRSDLINNIAGLLNTAFLPERVISVIDDMADTIAPYWEKHQNRWNLRTYDEWLDEIEKLREFARNRPGYVYQHVLEHFDEATGLFTLRVQISGAGRVKIGNILIDTETPGVVNPKLWEGVYFCGVPVPIYILPDNKNADFDAEIIDGGDGVILTGRRLNRVLTANSSQEITLYIDFR